MPAGAMVESHRCLQVLALAVALCAGCGSAPPPATAAPATPPAGAASAAPAAGAPGAADAYADGSPRVRARDFSIPVPPGFLSVTDERTPAELREKMAPVVAQGGVVLFAEKTEPGWFRGSIVVIPAAVGPVPTDAASCQQQSAEIAASMQAELIKAGIVDTRSCRWVLQDKARAQRLALGAVMESPSGAWVVTCNVDGRDEASMAACKKVLKGWRAGK